LQVYCAITNSIGNLVADATDRNWLVEFGIFMEVFTFVGHVFSTCSIIDPSFMISRDLQDADRSSPRLGSSRLVFGFEELEVLKVLEFGLALIC
jgi:hypothetical protein